VALRQRYVLICVGDIFKRSNDKIFHEVAGIRDEIEALQQKIHDDAVEREAEYIKDLEDVRNDLLLKVRFIGMCSSQLGPKPISSCFPQHHDVTDDLESLRRLKEAQGKLCVSKRKNPMAGLYLDVRKPSVHLQTTRSKVCSLN